MDAHNILFWLSLATGVIALGAIGFFRFARAPGGAQSPQVSNLPDK